ncbi:glycoside hydrolase family 1 protein [Desnuesiella massiliensis]|uniref:glycoside hydrolase family 1 protein n=1 Tax=Desnuesiella massiliensis TaxID=1650662 RepID=UPI0006E321FD|nr:glycoside hydrolase family 1 protein [Desnuesiella massiliensis]
MSNDKYNLSFPPNFLWGAACSATQTEGASLEHGKGKNIWDYWYEINPEKFFNNIGPKDTSNFYSMYKEDIKRMKEIGFNSFRTSISWSRLIPDGRGEINQEAVNFYNDVFDEFINQDITPIICLFHFDMPLAMQNIGGWENREIVEAFAEYAEQCFSLFGHKIKYWTTFNEPIVPVECGYLYEFHYPCVIDMKRAVQVAYNTAIASAKAIEKYKSLKQDGKAGIILNLTPSYPRDNENPEDLKAANIADLLFNRSFLDPAVNGKYPEELISLIKENDLIPVISDGDENILLNNKVDFLGVNYYQPRRVKAPSKVWDSNKPLMPEAFFDYYQWPERKMNKYRGWEIYEKGIYDIAMNIKNNYGNIPWYVSENGMGVQEEERFINNEDIIEDDYRIEFIKEHLIWLHKGISEGSNCFGYHIWTFMDNWSWLNGYKNRYGFFRVDIENNFKRSIKKSGLWFKKVAESNSLEISAK